jgi:chromosome segregation ATPase
MKDDEGTEQDNPVLFEKEIDYHRYWKERYEKEHKLRQEAEGEMTIVKGIGQNSPEMKAAKAKIDTMRKELDQVKLDNNNLYTRVADALEVNEHHQKLNGKLQSRITELEQDNLELHADNRKLAHQIEDKINQMRRSGM